ncbi:MAG: S41 family peptidase [Planctomycetota bacterium]|jgi:hypothetical protein
MIDRFVHAAAVTAVLTVSCLVAQEPPRVVKLEPAHLAAEVDALAVKSLTIHFDQPMHQGGHSICGGGPQFPSIRDKPEWLDAKTLVIPVGLEKGRSYRMSLNCPAAQNFRSAKGVALSPTPWSFSTLPDEKELLPARKQRQRNQRAMRALEKTLAAKYSYYEHKELDWEALFAEHEEAILSARTDMGWTVAVGQMLKPANDLHMYLKVDEQTVGTGSRRVDPLYRYQLLGQYFESLEEGSKGVLSGRTEDGYAYLMIGGWSGNIDFGKVEELIQGLGEDTKGLVIDVRPNSGGSETLARQVAQYFVDGTKVYAKHATRKGKGAKNFHPVSKREIRGKRDRDRFGKPVVVLMSRYCMSSCEAFLLMMKQAEMSTLVGQRSFGSSGNPKAHDLPNGVELYLPSWKVMRLDESCFEGEGIAPDVEVVVEEGDLAERDPILERGLEVLRGS